MSANGIAWLATKELKQKAKLDIAQAKRQGKTITEGSGTWSASGSVDSTKLYYRANNTYDITELPTQYTGDNITDNANTGGLVDSRPWTNGPGYSAGLYRSQYASWPNQNTSNPTWFDGKTAAATTVTTSSFNFALTSAQTNLGYQWLGYFKPDYTGSWTFNTDSQNIDDCLAVWVGANALSGYTTGNSLLNISVTSGMASVSLTAGTYYPIRIQFANNSGPGNMALGFNHTGQAQTNNFSGLIFYNPVTNGF